MKLALMVISFVFFAMMPAALADVQVNVDPLPCSGTYFITNVGSDQALQPAAPSLGQNVFLFAYNKSGSQKWILKRQINPKTKKPTNRYTIRLAGDDTELKLQPHPSIETATIISLDGATFVIEKGEAGMLLKKANGDALYGNVASPDSNSEALWGPDDGSAKFRWNFIPVN